MLATKISCNAERELGKAFINMFYLTVIGIFVTNPIQGGFEDFVLPLIVYILLAVFFLVVGLWLISNADERDDRKAKAIMQTEVRKGIFHIQSAELNTNQDNK